MKEISRSAMSDTYLVDREGRMLVLKILKKEVALDSHRRRRFLNEILILKSIRHERLIQIVDFGEIDGLPFYAMEWIRGIDLQKILQREREKFNQPLPFEITIEILIQILEGLENLHFHKDQFTGEHETIVHRDLCLSNILIDPSGRVKIIDFGVSKVLKENQKIRGGKILGHLEILSPEQLLGEVVDHRADLFALGAMAWELLVGVSPFGKSGFDPDYEILQRIEKVESWIKAPSFYNPKIPQILDQWVLRHLERNPDHRPQTAQVSLALLREIQSQYFPKPSAANLRKFIDRPEVTMIRYL